jgi:hypothetical protein
VVEKMWQAGKDEERRTPNNQDAVRDSIVLQKVMEREVFGVESVW